MYNYFSQFWWVLNIFYHHFCCCCCCCLATAKRKKCCSIQSVYSGRLRHLHRLLSHNREVSPFVRNILVHLKCGQKFLNLLKNQIWYGWICALFSANFSINYSKVLKGDYNNYYLKRKVCYIVWFQIPGLKYARNFVFCKLGNGFCVPSLFHDDKTWFNIDTSSILDDRSLDTIQLIASLGGNLHMLCEYQWHYKFTNVNVNWWDKPLEKTIDGEDILDVLPYKIDRIESHKYVNSINILSCHV